MKILVFAILSFAFATQSQAAPMTPKQFATLFIKTANSQIRAENAKLRWYYSQNPQDSKRYFCKTTWNNKSKQLISQPEGLNRKQQALITAALSNPEITVGEFRASILNDFKCFEPKAPYWSQKNLFNWGAISQDGILIAKVLEEIAQRTSIIQDDERLLEIFDRR